MTIIKLDGFDRTIRKVSRWVSGIGNKMNNKRIIKLGTRMLNLIFNRHGVPKDKLCWLSRDHLEY